MKKNIIKLISLILLLILPLGAFVTVTECLSDPYESTYLGAFDEKYDRLYHTEGKKIIFVGGSSLPFGLRSDLLEKELAGEYTVVNFGLYATLGTKFMMDTSKKAIGEGDIVVLCPELSTQTYSLYFNAEAVLQACNGFSATSLSLPVKNTLSLAYNYYKYAFRKIDYHIKDSAPDPTGIYRADSFNEYGDLAIERENNIMNNGYDGNMLISTDETLLDKEFIDYVNDYVRYADKRGATVYFNYSPANISAATSSKTARAAFEERLKEVLDCDLLCTVEDCFIDERYFYDTNFHLNSAGAIYFTDIIASRLKAKLGMEMQNTMEVPAPPALPRDEVVAVEPSTEKVDFADYNGEPNADYADAFEYKLVGTGYTIVGVKDSYLDMTEVILPSVYNGKNVTAVGENAFEGCTDLVRIHIGTTFKSLSVRSFAGCISLEGIYLYDSEGSILPPSDGLLDGAPQTALVYVPKLDNYTTGYTWTIYEDRLAQFTKG